jgi:hypothetical protein
MTPLGVHDLSIPLEMWTRNCYYVHTDSQATEAKRQTRRETGAQSHGSASEAQADRQTAE